LAFLLRETFCGFSKRRRKNAVLLVLAWYFAVGQVFAQAPYFQNKTIKIIRGGTPGGTGDADAMNRLGSNRFKRFSRSNR
jgi:hypothetical protein